MSISKPLLLATLGAATLGLFHGHAAAATNQTSPWCRTVTTSNQTIVSGSGAVLTLQSDGDLVVAPTSYPTAKLWSTGTAGRGKQLCFDSTGSLALTDASGMTLWRSSGSTSISPLASSYRYDLQMNGCSLGTTYTQKVTFPPSTKNGTLWSLGTQCPSIAANVVWAGTSGWCTDTNEESTIVQSELSELRFQTDGDLVLYGRGIADGTKIWSAGTAGSGAKLCFDPNGLFHINNASGQTVWSSGTSGATTTSYTLGLDSCSLNVKALTGTTPWSKANTCPQSQVTMDQVFTKDASVDVVMAETDQAKLVFDPTGNVVLKRPNGDVLWTTGMTTGKTTTASFQEDGNLVLRDPTNAYGGWQSHTASLGADKLVLDGCSFSIKQGDTVLYTKGTSSCDTTVRTNSPSWTLTNTGTTVVLQTDEATLKYLDTGNLVLYSKGGAVLWQSGTGSVQAGGGTYRLIFQTDGNLVIMDPDNKVRWQTGTSGVTSARLRLIDNCGLIIDDGSTTKWTGNASCTAVNYTFQQSDGNSIFGSTLRSNVTATNNGTARLDNSTAVDATVFGTPLTIFTATAYQTQLNDGSSLKTASVTALGEVTAAGAVSYSKTFFEETKTFMLGVVPVVVSAGATGEIGLALSAGDGTLRLTPSAGLYATLQAGVGVESDVGGASAGIRGTLTLLDLSLPISFKISLLNNLPQYTIKGDLTLTSLSGSLALYAEAYVKLAFLKVSADWSYTLFSWTGVQWTKNLFTKAGAF